MQNRYVLHILHCQKFIEGTPVNPHRYEFIYQILFYEIYANSIHNFVFFLLCTKGERPLICRYNLQHGLCGQH